MGIFYVVKTTVDLTVGLLLQKVMQFPISSIHLEVEHRLQPDEVIGAIVSSICLRGTVPVCISLSTNNYLKDISQFSHNFKLMMKSRRQKFYCPPNRKPSDYHVSAQKNDIAKSYFQTFCD